MAHICSHCNYQFSTKRSLNRHKKTAIYCLKIQKSLGIEAEEMAHKCNCGYKCYRKHQLTQHQVNCKTITNNTVNNISGNNNTVNNNNINITVNIDKITLSDFTNEKIISLLKPILNLEIIKSGMSAITEIIVTILFQDGRYIYYCTDKTRKVFRMLVNDKGEEITKIDSDAIFLRKLLVIPLRSLVKEIIGNDESEELQKTYNEVKSLCTEGKNFTNDLANFLPSSSESMPDSLLKILEENENQKLILDQRDEKEVLEKEKKKQALKKQIKRDNYKNYICNSEVYFRAPTHETHYLNKKSGFVIKRLSDRSVITGRDTENKFNKLTTKDIEYIKKLDLQEFIDTIYNH